MDKRYYIVVIDLLLMFAVILIIALMSVSFEKTGESNTNYNSIASLKIVKPAEQKTENDHVAITLHSNKIKIFQVTPTGTFFIRDYHHIDSFLSSKIYSRSINFVLFDDNESPFLADLIRALNRGKKIIFMASQ